MNTVYLGSACAAAWADLERRNAEYDAVEAAEYAEMVMVEKAMDAVVRNYHEEGQIFVDWLVADECRLEVLAKYVLKSLERPRSRGAEKIEALLEQYAKEAVKKLVEVRNG